MSDGHGDDPETPADVSTPSGRPHHAIRSRASAILSGRPHSLRGQLLRWLAAVQVATFVALAIAYAALTGELTPDSLGHDRAAELILEAVDRGGGQQIAVTEALSQYRLARPAFRYAVIDGIRPLPGSDPNLAKVGNIGLQVSDVRFHLDQVDGMAITSERQGRKLLVVTAGNKPDLMDLLFYAGALGQRIAVLLLPLLAISLLVTERVLRRALRPVEQLARQAGDIEVDQLDVRFGNERLTLELRPLASALNGLVDRLHEAFAQQRRFFDNAAHELRTPIAILAARIESLPAARRQELAADVRRLSILSDQLLASARSSSTEAREEVDVADLLTELVADYAPLAHRQGRGVALEMLNPLSVVADPRGLRSVFANLLDNALRAEPSGGCVTVRLGPGREAAVIDHGSGLPPASTRMFEPFWRGDARTDGAGLGLAIVREILLSQGFSVTASSSPKGGAVFTVLFHRGRSQAR